MTVSGGKIYFEFDPFEIVGVEAPEDPFDRATARREIADLVLGEVLDYVARGASPVKGGKWKYSISDDYADRKADWSNQLFANMEMTGDMLDSLEVWQVGGKLRLGIRDKDEAKKADGHNNHSGKSRLPAREFIPKEGGTFKRPILSAIREIIRDIEGE
jgi:hypothetical protein